MRAMSILLQLGCSSGCVLTGLGCTHQGHTAAAPAPRSSQANDAAAPTPDETDAQLQQKIALLEQILAEHPQADHAKVRLNLAETYWSCASRVAMRRFELLDEKIGASTERRAQLDRQDDLLAQEQRRWLGKTIASFQTLLTKTGPTAVTLRPAAYLGLADALAVHGDKELRKQALVDLVRDAPEHPFASVALTQLGDLAFDEVQLDEAREFYERAVVTAAPTERLYSEYKLGWIAFNFNEGVVALEKWSRVVAEGRVTPGQRALADAAAKDCVLAFSQVGQPIHARAFFVRLHPELAPRLLIRLADTYRAEGRDADAALVAATTALPQ